MIDEAAIRQLLIDSCHSSETAKQFFETRLDDSALLGLLIRIARDADDHGGDAPMEAAYWISQYPARLLLPHEPVLLEMLPIVNGYGGHVALALGKTRSPRGRAAIIEELGSGDRLGAWLFHKAIEAADGDENPQT